MAHPQYTSQSDIAARIDAALADAGLASADVERDPVALYLGFIDELVEGKQSIRDKELDDIVECLESWREQHIHTHADVRQLLRDNLNDVLELARAHNTLTDFKRQELLNIHGEILRGLAACVARARTSL